MAENTEPVIVSGVPVPKVRQPGRPKGAGCNLRLLARLKPGDMSSCIWGCSKKKMNSIRTSAWYGGIPLKIRVLEGDLYAIWKLNKQPID
jgi:hypothetical protein